MQPAGSNFLKGAACGFDAVSIWASWSVLTRLAVTTSLDAWDIAALRFGVAGLVLLPVVVRRGLARDRLGWLGLVVIFAGVVVIIGWHGGSGAGSLSHTVGDALFLFAEFLTACFTVAMRQAKLNPLHAAALVATGSLVIYLPIYLALCGIRLALLPPADIALQATFQGVLVTIVGVVLYGRAVAILGAAAGAAFGALVPALSALLAIPLLGKWPDKTEWLAIILISGGVYLASGAPLPRRTGFKLS